MSVIYVICSWLFLFFGYLCCSLFGDVCCCFFSVLYVVLLNFVKCCLSNCEVLASLDFQSEQAAIIVDMEHDATAASADLPADDAQT
jgi:hypothetical protein